MEVMKQFDRLAGETYNYADQQTILCLLRTV